jgi:hypothetical protein
MWDIRISARRKRCSRSKAMDIDFCGLIGGDDGASIGVERIRASLFGVP